LCFFECSYVRIALCQILGRRSALANEGGEIKRKEKKTLFRCLDCANNV